jgi:TLP18.3/Psb32/MOLO-1 phosphatase superfamily protein
MHWGRAFKHLLTPDWIAMRPFSAPVLKRIEDAIGASEQRHRGELRFALEASLEPLDVLRAIPARTRALDVFSALRVWDTAENSGVLIYLQMVDRRIEIVADRGINRLVEQSAWDSICRRMEGEFRAGRFEAGTLAAIGEVTELLATHFPPQSDNPDELPNRPVVLT